MHLVGFHYKNISRCTVLWMSKLVENLAPHFLTNHGGCWAQILYHEGQRYIISCNMLRIDVYNILCVCEQLTPQSTVLPQRRIFPQPVKIFPAFHGTRKFIIAFTQTTNSPYPEPVQDSPSLPFHTQGYYLKSYVLGKLEINKFRYPFL